MKQLSQGYRSYLWFSSQLGQRNCALWIRVVCYLWCFGQTIAVAVVQSQIDDYCQSEDTKCLIDYGYADHLRERKAAFDLANEQSSSISSSSSMFRSLGSNSSSSSQNQVMTGWTAIGQWFYQA